MNQVVSAALVAQREVDEEAAAAAEPADGKPKIPPAGPGAGKARLPADSDAIRTEPAQSSGVVQKKKMMQHPVYFVSSLLQGARSRYFGVQKFLFGLLMASRKLRHYFRAHEITVVNRLPLQRILHNPDATERIVEWDMELLGFGLKFESTSTMKKKMMQHPVYFVSSLLQGARSRYFGVQKFLFGLLMASRKLRHYFRAHEITVVNRLPLQRILHNPDATERIVEWDMELLGFGLKFESTSTILPVASGFCSILKDCGMGVGTVKLWSQV